MSTKYCPKCADARPVAEFYTNKSRPDGLSSYCKTHSKAQQNARYSRDPNMRARMRAQAKAWQQTHREYLNKRQKYAGRGRQGTEAEYAQLLARAAGKCEICSATCSLHVDHNHTTGKLRGMLCFNCNTAIGKLQDSPELLEKAAAYLRERA